MTINLHNFDRRDWPKQTWEFPLIHNFEFGFGLSAEASTKASTIVPYVFQDNALVDYELIKTNPENADFAVVAHGNTMAGSHVPKCLVDWTMYIPAGDTEIVHLKANTMKIHTAFLNRLDAFDKKTGDDIETILELQHETTDEQCYPLFNGTKLFESGGVYDMPYPDHPGTATDGQMEGVAFDKEKFFDAKHYYTNGEMLNSVTDQLRDYTISEPLVPHGRSIIHRTSRSMPSMCKTMNPYTFYGELFHVPQVDSIDQYHLSGQTTAIEHLTVKGRVRFAEYNPDFNFSRA